MPFSPLEDTILPVADWPSASFPLGVLDFEHSTGVNRMQCTFKGLEILGFRGPQMSFQAYTGVSWSLSVGRKGTHLSG